MGTDLAPGAIIDDRELTGQPGIGRTPRRESILRLEQEGLVVSRGRRGCFIAETSPLDLFRAFEIRREIEGFAAERRNGKDIEAFPARLEAELADHLNDVRSHLNADEAFHCLIAAAPDNSFAAQYQSFLSGLSVRSLYLSHVPVTPAHDEMDGDRAMFEAIRRCDAASTKALMREHLTISPMQGLMSGTSVSSLRKSV